jgi:hypothetical protein
MTIECYVSSPMSWGYDFHGARMFEISQTISSMTNISIIDCYSVSATPNRYKGDPIANSIWTSSLDVSDENSWIIIECTTSRYPSLNLPNWQAKIQWCNTAVFADVSGSSYGAPAQTRQILMRFATYGGWTLADSNPDFVGPGGESSSQNKKVAFQQPNGTMLKSIFVEDTGTLMWIAKNAITGTTETFLTITAILGDITVIDETVQTMPRVFVGGPSGNITTITIDSWLCEENTTTNYFSNSSFTTWDYTKLGIGYVNPSGTWVEEAFQTQPGWDLMNSFSQPTLHTPSPEIDILPYLVSTYSSRLIGELPLIGKGYGVGVRLLSDRQLCSMSGGYGLFIRWDGTTSLG